MKKLIVEIDDKFAGAATMSFIGTNVTIPVTVAAIILKQDVTTVAISEDGSNIVLEDDFASTEKIPLEKLINAVRQLEDLCYDRKEFADYDEEDNAFVRDIEAIDIALMAIKQLIHMKTAA